MKNKIFSRYFLFFLTSIFGFLFLLFTDLGIYRWYQLKEKRSELRLEIDSLLIEENNLSEKLNQLKHDEEYIKKIAREKFHMAKHGEKIFRIRKKTK